MIKSFRGLMLDGGQDTIRLGTNQGLIGYRIKKFQIMPSLPTSGGHKEHVVQIWKVYQTTVPTVAADVIVDFSNGLLLGAAWSLNSDSPAYATTQDVIFDSEVFNQDIYVTHTDTDGTDTVNYYIELEQVKLDVNEAAVATLKDMRGRE